MCKFKVFAVFSTHTFPLQRDSFTNPKYVPSAHETLKIIPRMPYITMWNGYFLRWHQEVRAQDTVEARMRELKDLAQQAREQNETGEVKRERKKEREGEEKGRKGGRWEKREKKKDG